MYRMEYSSTRDRLKFGTEDAAHAASGLFWRVSLEPTSLDRFPTWSASRRMIVGASRTDLALSRVAQRDEKPLSVS